jgi:hypothetical protein
MMHMHRGYALEYKCQRDHALKTLPHRLAKMHFEGGKMREKIDKK